MRTLVALFAVGAVIVGGITAAFAWNDEEGVAALVAGASAFVVGVWTLTVLAVT